MRRRAIKGIVWKDLKEVGRERMTVFWILVFPMMWLLVMGGIWGHTNPPVTVKVGVVAYDETGWEITHYMGNVTLDGKKLFKVEPFNETTGALNRLKSGKLDAVLVFPKGFGENLSAGLPVKVFVYYDKSDPQEYQIARGAVEGFFSEFSHRLGEQRGEALSEVLGRELPENLSVKLVPLVEGVASPLTIKEAPVAGRSENPVLFFLAGVMGIQFLFATMSLIGNGTLREIEKGTLRRIASSPATAWDFLLGKFLSTTILIFGSILGLIVFSKLVFGATIVPSLLGWGFLFTAGFFSMGLGLAIAMATRSIRTTSAAINLISWPLMFLAGIVVPPSVLPDWSQPIAQYFPIGRALQDFRLLEIYHVPTSTVASDLFWLALTSLGMMFIAILTYRWALKRLE